MNLYGYHIDYHRGDAPLTPGKPLGEATHVEVLAHPYDPTRAFLHCLWPDSTAYVLSWSRDLLARFMERAQVTPTVTETRTWSLALEVELKAGAKPCPGKGWCTHDNHQWV